MRKYKAGLIFLGLCAIFILCECNLHADLLMELEGENFSQIDQLIESTKSQDKLAQNLYYRALEGLYKKDYRKSSEFLARLSTETYTYAGWLKNYLNDVMPILSGMKEAESEHFILKAKEGDLFLSEYALDALEKAYQRIGKDLNLYPRPGSSSPAKPRRPRAHRPGSVLSSRTCRRTRSLSKASL